MLNNIVFFPFGDKLRNVILCCGECRFSLLIEWTEF